MAKLLMIIFSLFIVLSVNIPSSIATVYTVGDSAGWDISANLLSWTSNKTFYVGDVLLFQYSRYHSLNEVNKEGFDTCNTSNTLLTGNTGNSSVTLTAPGEKYFICGVFSHCLGGMKLKVQVNGDGSASDSDSGELSPVVAPPQPPPLQGGSSSKNNESPSSVLASVGARDSLFSTWLLCVPMFLLFS
ncbi:hypothetical protein J5N97_029681 [Dioscorea zingiberensis]|uniref:Phytocyanin domain-containing protein n=1 Tax=Dioscorea zingiberensis TaxID=325984 RepID=A0A9D5BWC9_9LILI|nr:hypothetical protein J5N97_029681 [Dioscorea zingiberensis]